MTVFTAEAEKVSTELAYKGLISEQLWERLVGRLVKDENMERPLAERVMNEALGFLQLCAKEPNAAYSPSETVDPGWHTFVLYTRDYAAFCERIAGRFIHHNPTDIPGADYSGGFTAKQTAEAMQQYGPVDEMLWTRPGADCDGCSNAPCTYNPKADCNDSGCHGGSCNQGCSGGGR